MTAKVQHSIEALQIKMEISESRRKSQRQKILFTNKNKQHRKLKNMKERKNKERKTKDSENFTYHMTFSCGNKARGK